MNNSAKWCILEVMALAYSDESNQLTLIHVCNAILHINFILTLKSKLTDSNIKNHMLQHVH